MRANRTDPEGQPVYYVDQDERSRAYKRAQAKAAAWVRENRPDIWRGLYGTELEAVDEDPDYQPPRKRAEPAPCGTPAAYKRHLRHGEPTDNACRQAWRDYLAERKRTRRARLMEEW